ncbi:helix-turn-helix transcriptional regulator [Ferrimonas lipolytica]|uniref:Regulatory protein, luxR family n=1 Tax=Ferrimonas lipolytica TaxID=2724191 RepID=A0A6H1UAQ2_9GAMM|nr:hypothetical protein [Ferrimonas lipolytica]QIZ75670.1 hypothetical protein HER31_01380 [Ferrimonas lipolytica]
MNELQINENSLEAMLVSELKSLGLSVGAVDAMFQIDFNNPDSWLGKDWLKRLKLRGSLKFTSEALANGFDDYRNGLTTIDFDLCNTVRKEIHFWRCSNQHSGKMRESGGYSKMVSVTLPLPQCEELCGRFLFFFDRSCQQSSSEVRQSINNALNEMSFYQNAAKSSNLLKSPLQDYGMLKPASLSILRGLAQGYSRNELSDLHYMTPRGVDYHLERMKNLLGAKNIHSMLYKSTNLMLI